MKRVLVVEDEASIREMVALRCLAEEVLVI